MSQLYPEIRDGNNTRTHLIILIESIDQELVMPGSEDLGTVLSLIIREPASFAIVV